MQGSISKKGKNYYIRYYDDIHVQKKQIEKVIAPSTMKQKKIK